MDETINFIKPNKNIGCGKIDKIYLLHIFFIFFLLGFYYFFQDFDSILTAHCIINILFCHLISFFASFLFYIIIIFRSQNYCNKNRSSSYSLPNNQKFIIKKKKNNTFKKQIIFLLICEVIFTFSLSLSYILRIKLFNLVFESNIEIIFIVLQMLFTVILCHFIIKHKIEKHNSLGLIIMGIGILINTSSFFIYKEYYYVTKEYFYEIAFISIIIISFREVLEKYIMKDFYISPYLILIIGDFCNIFFFILLLKKHEKIRDESIRDYIKDNIIKLLACGVFFSAQNICRIQLNEKFSPTHRITIDLIISIIYSFERILINFLPFYYYPYLIIGFFFMIFGILVYNEIIIIYVYNFHLNVKFIIALREKSELMISLNNEINDSKNNSLGNYSSESSSLYSYAKTSKFN
jgi:hypothetical protein